MCDKKEYMKQYRIKNREKRKEYNKQWFLNNGTTCKEYMDKYRERNKEKIKAYYKKNREKIKENYLNNKEKCLKNSKEWQLKNREKVKEYRKKHYNKNKERLCEYHRQWNRNKRKTCPRFKLNYTLGDTIRRSLNGNKAGRHWENLVGYSLDDLMKRLKSTLPQNYNWQDFLDGKLHVDHIIPISAFEFDKPEDFQFIECWSLKNLRLLPAKENIIKGSKIIKPYQLALKI